MRKRDSKRERFKVEAVRVVESEKDKKRHGIRKKTQAANPNQSVAI